MAVSENVHDAAVSKQPPTVAVTVTVTVAVNNGLLRIPRYGHATQHTCRIDNRTRLTIRQTHKVKRTALVYGQQLSTTTFHSLQPSTPLLSTPTMIPLIVGIIIVALTPMIGATKVRSTESVVASYLLLPLSLPIGKHTNAHEPFLTASL